MRRRTSAGRAAPACVATPEVMPVPTVPPSRPMAQSRRLSPSASLARLPGPRGERFVTAFEHGSLVIEYYALRARRGWVAGHGADRAGA
jgi:hypothetical protein